MGGGTIYVQPVLTGHHSPPNLGENPPQEFSEGQPSPDPRRDEEFYGNRSFSNTHLESRTPLGVVILDKIINGTWGSLSLDLKRPQLPQMGARTSLFTFKEPPEMEQQRSGFGPSMWPSTGRRRRGRPSRAELEARRQQFDYDSLPSIAFSASGARVKAMRHVSFGPSMQFSKYGREFTAPAFDIGAGFDFEFDTAELRPIARLKFQDAVSLKLLPCPAFKFQKRLQLGTSGFAVRMSYECPFQNLSRFFAPPARLMISIDNAIDTGIQLTQSGIEFAANKWLLDGAVRVRGVGMLRLPSELPIDEDNLGFGIDMKRLGIKSRW